MLQSLLSVLIAALGVVRALISVGFGLLPLLAAGPAFAAAIGGTAYVLAMGAEAMTVCAIFLSATAPGSRVFGSALVGTVAVAATTVGGAIAATRRAHRERELARVRLVADATQQVVLRPVPREAGPARFAARYLSASEEARVGGDLYEVVSTPDWVRFVIGDAQGKGLPVLRCAVAVLGAFREAAYEEQDLAAIACRIEASLARQLGPEEYVTAILAEVPAGRTRMEILNCGHPVPVRLGPGRPRFLAGARGGLPLGLADLTGAPRHSVTVPFKPGDRVLFYTDGLTEARDRAGGFFPLLDSAALRSPQPADILLDRLSQEMIGFIGHSPADDVALLLACRDTDLPRPAVPRKQGCRRWPAPATGGRTGAWTTTVPGRGAPVRGAGRFTRPGCSMGCPHHDRGCGRRPIGGRGTDHLPQSPVTSFAPQAPSWLAADGTPD